jgi:tetratricopeptide (TPR) repeat protein
MRCKTFRFSAPVRQSAALLAALCSCLLITVPGSSQMNMSCHDMGKMVAVPPPESLPAPLRIDGLGNSHLKITATPEAQMWFDQGLNEQHDFWNYEAARSFEQAIRVDPKCAMCYWGLSGAMGFYHSDNKSGYAQTALDKAVALKGHASKQEQLYIEATVADHDQGNAPPDPKVESKATQLWRKAVAKDPKDNQAKIFLALSLEDGYTDAGEPKPGTQKAIDILAAVLKTDPNDSAVNHYWIHAMEPSNHPERAIESAKRLAGLSPASGHMVHMPGHIFYRTGDYADADIWFAKSTAVDEAYMRAQHINVDDDWNYVHNLMYGIDNLMQEGKLQEASTLSGKLAGARGEFIDTLYTFAPRDSMTRVNTQLPIALRTGNWRAVQSLLADSKPDAKLENLVFLSGELKTFATGMFAVQSGDLKTAQATSNELDADLWHKTQALKDAPKPEEKKPKPGDPVMAMSMPDAMPEPLLASLSIMSLELRASILADQKNLPEAKKLFTQAALEEKKLGYREPPTYIRPVGETEGFAMLNAGDAEGAHAAFAAALADRPNSGFALYGMARSSEAEHHTDIARDEYVRFLDAWRNADAAAPELAHAHQYLTGQSVMATVDR